MMRANKLNCFLVFLIVIYVFECHGQKNILVFPNVGGIRGHLDNSGELYKFLGIPYGTVKWSPFGVATPHPKFDKIFDANNDAEICPQDEDGVPIGVTNCLNLNVYVPATANATSQLPVIIFLYGGFFMRGNAKEGLYGPKYLVRHDVILVVPNYRTGPYGFMCLGLDSVPGNQGLKDQQLAMEWVKQNIEAFGGNANDITLMGQSAGGHAVNLHLLSQRRKLYNKVIIQSGSSLAATLLYEPDRNAAIRMAELLGLRPNSSYDAVSLLSEVDAHSVIRVAIELKIEFKPCVETEFQGVDSFITHSWINTVVPKVQNMPILIGFTEHERTVNHIKPVEHFENLDIFNSFLNQTFNFSGSRLKRMEEYMRQFYLGDSAISKELVWRIIDFDSDFVYNHPIQRSIKQYLASGVGDIFYYMFTYSGARNKQKIYNNASVEVAAHGDEMGYLFDKILFSEEVNPQDQVILDRMTTMWTNFVKYGNPTPETTELYPVKWEPLTKETYNFLRIDSNLTMDKRPFNSRMTFFNLFYEHNNEYQKTFDD